MKLILKIWRQAGPLDKGKLVAYPMDGVEPDMSFLETLDMLNETLILKGEPPVAFDHDCREGICGACGFMVDGVAHGPLRLTTVCQLFMRHFRDGATLTVEPFRARVFSPVQDLVVDRGALDRIIQEGGFISARTGAAPEANSIPVPKRNADLAFDAAACIACGACVAACPNASAMLFTAAKVSHLALLPQGHPERHQRAMGMVNAMEKQGFGGCSNHGECEAVCPKGISLYFIARLNREFLRANILENLEPGRKV